MFYVTTFYDFFAIEKDSVPELCKFLTEIGNTLTVKGSFLISTEGINVTACARTPEQVKAFEQEVTKTFLGRRFWFKHSKAEILPFRRWLVQERETIVNMGGRETLPKVLGDTHVSPEEWDQLMGSDDVVVLDTRNDYEFEIGHFKDSIELEIEEFQYFGKALKAEKLDKDKTYLIYCTGGIRCEKAVVEMHRQGFKKVKQLDGGIINYLDKRPNSKFEGECFIFDHRVALDQQLQQSKKYGLCPHTGLIGSTKIVCKRCGTEALVHDSALVAEHFYTCSKNCSHHYQLNPKQGRRQKRSYESA